MIFILQNPAADSSFSFPNVKGAYRSEISYLERINCPKGTPKLTEEYQLTKFKIKEVWLLEINSLDDLMKLLRDEWIVYHANHEISFDPNYPYPTLRINNIY